MGHDKIYLLRILIDSNVLLDPEGPVQVNLVLVEGEQEHNENEDCVHHTKRKYDVVP